MGLTRRQGEDVRGSESGVRPYALCVLGAGERRVVLAVLLLGEERARRRDGENPLRFRNAHAAGRSFQGQHKERNEDARAQNKHRFTRGNPNAHDGRSYCVKCHVDRRCPVPLWQLCVPRPVFVALFSATHSAAPFRSSGRRLTGGLGGMRCR
jgi:hypothetical protein